MARWSVTTLLPVKKRLLPLEIKNKSLGTGFSVISIFCAIFGKWISIPPIRFQPSNIFYYILQCYSFIITFICTINFMLSLLVLQDKNTKNLLAFVYFTCGCIAQLECCLRLYIIHFKKNKIEKLVTTLQKIISETKLQKHQRNIKRRLTRFIIFMLILFFTSYALAFVSNFLSHRIKLKEIQSRNNFTLDASIEQLEYESYIRTLKKYTPFSEVEVSFYGVYIVSSIGVIFLVVTDVLFYALYYIILAELQVIIQILNKCISNDSNKMEWWLRNHQLLMRLLKETNKITSPAVTLSVIISSCQMCFVAFIAVKHFHQEMSTINTIAILVFGATSLLQFFVYCYLGQKMRDKISELQSATYRAPWLDSGRDTQHTALMICSATNERSMQLPGAPFFTLSLDFFASVIGVMLTYFIILLQFK